jgi:phospholipase C
MHLPMALFSKSKRQALGLCLVFLPAVLAQTGTIRDVEHGKSGAAETLKMMLILLSVVLFMQENRAFDHVRNCLLDALKGFLKEA